MLAFINLTSPSHIIVIGLVALLLFGNRLPEVARSLGRAFNEFKRGLKDVEEHVKSDSDTPEDKPKDKLEPPKASGESVSRGEKTPEQQRDSSK